jgi:membrane fusion protein (multidrug efflux system)
MLGFFRRFGFAAIVTAGLALMVVLVAGKVAWTSVTGGGDAAQAVQAGKGGRGAPGGPGGAVPVVAAVVDRQAFTDNLQAIGSAQARESIVLTPKVADTIRAIRFESGARVRRGQVLVEMSSVEQTADLAEAQAANQAAQEELRRAQELFDRGFASQARLDTVRAAADAAQARVNASSSRIADRTIRAPFAGVVGLRTASPGQYMRPGDQIGTLDDISEIKLDFTVPETQVARLAAGVEIIARTAAFPDRAFTGAIANVDSRIDPTTRTVRVRAILPNQDEIIRPGMLMTVEVRTNPRQALVVPEIALIDEADGVYAFRIVGGEGAPRRAERVRVEIGTRSGGRAEVLGGLNEGDQVVVQGVQGVRPGQPVRIQEAPDAAADAPRQPRG